MPKSKHSPALRAWCADVKAEDFWRKKVERIDIICGFRILLNILTANIICHEYGASRSRKAANFLMRLCASSYAKEQMVSAPLA